MNFNEPTTGQRRTADDQAPVGAPAGESSSANLIHGSGDEQAGRDRRPRTPNLPHVGERWRHLRTGIEAEVLWRYEDSLLTSAGPTVWPIDLFCAKWVRA
jgi:hypothetical protein